MQHWTWSQGHLRDPQGQAVAQVRDRVIHVGPQHLLTEVLTRSGRLVVKATTSRGEVFTLTQAGFSVSHLEANCAGRRYMADRVRPLGRERELVDAAGATIARTRPRSADLAVDVPDDAPATPVLDFVFMTWACLNIDNSRRLRRM